MKISKPFLLLSLIVCCIFVIGCNTQHSALNTQNLQSFPQELVGTWKADGKSGWEITVDSNGTISEIILPLGRFNIKNGEVANIKMMNNKISVVEPGEWFLMYDPDTKEINIQIKIDNYKAQIGEDFVEGSESHVITGIVSGETDWTVDWAYERKALAYTQQYPDGFDMSTPPDESPSRRITFTKLPAEQKK